MTRLAVEEYAAALRPRYRTATRREKQKILDEFCETTGRHRKAAIRLLNLTTKPRARRQGRPRRYGPEVTAALARLWEVGDRMCSKLLHAVMPDLLLALERHGELRLPDRVRSLVLQASPATIDRLLRRHRRGLLRQPERRQPTTTGLKSQVPIKTWSEWRDVPVGSLQADLVLHCGERSEGFYLTTLCAVDVATGWTELQPVWGLGKHRVGGAVHLMRKQLPFPVKALHTDNGAEFINHLLVPWCVQEKISLTRGRSYRKNDQAYVEQRNWLSVRRQVGYDRLSTRDAYRVLQRLYPLLCRQLNFFRPVRKLVHKERVGAKVVKRYDEPATPYQRIVASNCLTDSARSELERQYLACNPAALQASIDTYLRTLWRLGQRERSPVEEAG
jgi:hypothetical protein